MKRDTLLIIGAGRHQTSVIQVAAKAGFFTVAVDIDPKAAGFSYCHAKLVHSAYDADGVLNRLDEAISPERIAGVLTQAARGCTLAVARIAERLGLRALNSETAELLLSKEATRRLFDSDMLIGSFEPGEQIPPTMAFPLVLKYEGLSGSLGVFKVDNKTRLHEIRESQKSRVIMEKYVEGRHLGVIGVKSDSDCHIYGSIEKVLNADLTIDHTIFPAQISTEVVRKLKDYTAYVLDKTHFDFGPFQLELILTGDDELFFVELEPSILGSYISEIMIPAVSQNDMIRDVIDLVASGGMGGALHDNAFVCVQKYHYADRSGIVGEFKMARSDRRLLFMPYLSIGERLVNPRLYVANSLVVGRNAGEALEQIHDFELTIAVN